MPKRYKRKTCYAVAKGKVPGIYYEWKEASEQVLGFSEAVFKGFDATADADRYLQGYGLESAVEGNWMSTSHETILYVMKQNLPTQSSDGTTTNDIDEDPISAVYDDDDGNDNEEYNHREQQQQQQQQVYDAENEEICFDPSNKRLKIIDCSNDPWSDQQGHDVYNDNENDNNDLESNEQDYTLDAIQKSAIDAALEGKNVFLTGVAGTGKSFVTKKIVENAKLRKQEVAVAAPTGVAAVNLNLGAQTVHSLAGIRVPKSVRDFQTMWGRPNLKKWRRLEVLVIDEVGMMTADFLDWLDVQVRKIRFRELEVFGGIQLIFVGDFAQLGPIPGRISLRHRAYRPTDPAADCYLDIKECTAYAFQSVMWREANFFHVHLKKVYRQNDEQFIAALMDLRVNKADSELVRNLVNDCKTPLETREDLTIPEGIKPTVLYCTNKRVDKENGDSLRALSTEAKRFEAIDTVTVDDEVPISFRPKVASVLEQNGFFHDCQAARNLDLKIGAQVMLLQNLDRSLVNGSRGVIECFRLVPVARNSRGEEKLITPDDHEKFEGPWEAIKYGKTLTFEGQGWKVFKFVKYPQVKFVNNQTKIIVPTIFERFLFRQGTCHRLQVPLRLAWAMTMHKSQGSTLDLVICDLFGCFTSGQAYVALSRAKTMTGLQIKNYAPSCVKTDHLVEGFYDALDNDTMKEFLEEEAGLWWYPILDSPTWLDLFQNASSPKGKLASEIFRQWLVDYPMPEKYLGWRSFVDDVPTKPSSQPTPYNNDNNIASKSQPLFKIPDSPTSTPTATASNSDTQPNSLAAYGFTASKSWQK